MKETNSKKMKARDIDVMNAEEMYAIEDMDELRKLYSASNQEFKDGLSEITDPDELERIEAELMEIMDEHDRHIKEVQYDLPNEVTFEDEKFSRAKIATRIKSLLERHEVEFTYVYGLYDLCKFWATNPATIGYGVLDSTLRLLEQLKYAGRDWRTILVINAFFQKGNNLYNHDMTRTIFLAERHNIIMDQMKLGNPLEPDTAEEVPQVE